MTMFRNNETFQTFENISENFNVERTLRLDIVEEVFLAFLPRIRKSFSEEEFLFFGHVLERALKTIETADPTWIERVDLGSLVQKSFNDEKQFLVESFVSDKSYLGKEAGVAKYADKFGNNFGVTADFILIVAGEYYSPCSLLNAREALLNL